MRLNTHFVSSLCVVNTEVSRFGVVKSLRVLKLGIGVRYYLAINGQTNTKCDSSIARPITHGVDSNKVNGMAWPLTSFESLACKPEMPH